MDYSLYLDIAARLAAAWTAGALIGLDRSYHDKPAGFRTYALVALASAMIIVLMAFQHLWLTQPAAGTFQSDPIRAAQGILTGIGFLGAGTIFRERQIMRGLTTAASIWMAAALGILYGAGFYPAALIATAITLVTLILLRGIETRLPSRTHALYEVRFPREQAWSRDQMDATLRRHDIGAEDVSYILADGGARFGYHMKLWTKDRANFERLSRTLCAMAEVSEFHISPTDD